MEHSTAVMASREDEAAEEQQGLDLLTFTQWMQECQEQPAWRSRADKEADYCDGTGSQGFGSHSTPGAVNVPPTKMQSS